MHDRFFSLLPPIQWSASPSPPQKVRFPHVYFNSLIYRSTGNQGLRHFPYTGYLGLTPIRVEGCALHFLSI
jgi:hypothetical protein